MLGLISSQGFDHGWLLSRCFTDLIVTNLRSLNVSDQLAIILCVISSLPVL